MKFYNLFLASLLLLIISGEALAESPEPILLFSVSNNKKVRVGAINNSEKTLQLIIKNSNSEEILRTAVKSGEEYFEFHNLSKLPPGKYTLTLKSSKYKVQKTFNISETDIQLEASLKSDIRHDMEAACSLMNSSHEFYTNHNLLPKTRANSNVNIVPALNYLRYS